MTVASSSNAMKKEFFDAGYCVIQGLISNRRLNSIKSDISSLINAYLKSFTPNKTNSTYSLDQCIAMLRCESEDLYSEACKAINNLVSIRALASNSRLLTCVRHVVQDKQIAIYHQNVIISPPSREWPLSFWHQDSYSSDLLHLVVNIALTDTNIENGGIKVIHSGHKNGYLPHEKCPTLKNATREHMRIIDSNADFLCDKRQLILSPGDAVIMDSNLPHCGGVNSSNGTRIVVAVRYTSIARALNI